MLRLIFYFTLVYFAISQSCLSPTGQPVHWWIALKVPPKLGTEAYGYYDSVMKTGKFVYRREKIDIGETPLTKTF